MKAKISEKIVVFVIFWLMAMGLCPDAALDPQNTIIGDSKSDLWDHLWGYWRTEKSIFWYGEYPLEETFINYPNGGTLYHVDFLNSLIMIPLRTTLGMVLAYNILVWLHMSAAGVAMYSLVRRFVRSRTAGGIAAFAFVFNPQMLVFTLASGVANRLNLIWIPLFFIAIDMWVREDKIRGVILAPIFCFLAAIGCWHYAYYIFMLMLVLSLGTILRNILSWRGLLFWAIKWTPIAALCAAVLLPVSLLASESISTEGNEQMVQREHSIFFNGSDEELSLINEFALIDYVQIFHSGPMKTVNFDLLYETPYVGWALLLLAPMVMFSRKKLKWALLVGAAYFLMLSLGTDILIFHGEEKIRSALFFLSARLIPFMTAQEVPWEYIIPANFCLSIALAFGFDYIVGGFPHRYRVLLSVQVVAILILELVYISPVLLPIPSTKVEYSDYYMELRHKPQHFAVFDFPSRRDKSSLLPTEFFFYQSIHYRPIPYAIMDAWIDKNEFWGELTRVQQSGGMRNFSFTGVEKRVAKSKLYRDGYRYFLLHKKLMNKQSTPLFLSFFSDMFGEPVYEDEFLWSFEVTQ